ncbi:uncharacterized protein VP01_6217g2, partial [Puccinia sorghi]
PYLDKVFNKVPVVFDDFLNDFRSSFFNHNRRDCAEVALRNLCQTGTMLAYMQDVNQHSLTVGEIQLAVLMSNVEQVRQLKESNKTALTPTLKPNLMDLSAFQKAQSNQLSHAKQARWVQQNLYFQFSKAGHISLGCWNGVRNPKTT